MVIWEWAKSGKMTLKKSMVRNMVLVRVGVFVHGSVDG